MGKEDMGKMIEILVFSVAYAIMAMCHFYRLLKGPNPADRMVAGDSTDILITCAMVLYSVYSGRAIYLDIAIITAMLGIVDTMLVGRYLDTGRWRNK